MAYQEIKIDTYLIDAKDYRNTSGDAVDPLRFKNVENWKELDADKLNPTRIEGAIVITIYGSEVTTIEYWDDVESLWHYFLNAFKVLESNSSANFSYPNQPIPVRLEKKAGGGDYLRFVLEDSSFGIPRKTFIGIACDAALQFFYALQQLFPLLKHEYQYPIEQFNAIKGKL